MKFKGKIGVLFISIVLVINAGLLFAFFADEILYEKILILIALIISDIFFASVTFQNYALLEDEYLLIVFGFVKRKIRYSHITSIKRTHNPLSSYGLTLDRLGIECSVGYYLISIKEKERFMREVLTRNPLIKVDL